MISIWKSAVTGSKSFLEMFNHWKAFKMPGSQWFLDEIVLKD